MQLNFYGTGEHTHFKLIIGQMKDVSPLSDHSVFKPRVELIFYISIMNFGCPNSPFFYFFYSGIPNLFFFSVFKSFEKTEFPLFFLLFSILYIKKDIHLFFIPSRICENMNSQDDNKPTLPSIKDLLEGGPGLIGKYRNKWRN